MGPLNRSLSPSGLVRLSDDGRSGVIHKQYPGICTWCGEGVPKGRVTWCSNRCVYAYRLTQPEVIRKLVRQRDRGICKGCNVNTKKLRQEIDAKVRAEGKLPVVNWLTSRGRPTTTDVLKHLQKRKTLWDMDHITPVSKGGHPFSLENLRTLCYWCHKGVTSALLRERKS